MKLTKINGKNIMGASFQLALDDLNIVYGPNLSGKTRVRRAIELVLLGYSPSLDKKPQSIFKLSSGAKMEVEATLQERQKFETQGNVPFPIPKVHEIHRSWEQSGGSVKAKHHVPLGLDGRMPLVMMDAGDYFSRSARGRVELIFESAPNTTAVPSVIIKSIFDKLGPGTAGMICGKTEMSDDLPIAEVVNLLCETAEGLRSEAAANVRRYSGTIQGLSALQLDDKAPQRSVEAIDAELANVQCDIGRLCENYAQSEKLQREEETNELERERLMRLIAQAGDPVPREFDIDALRSKEKELKNEIAIQDNFKLNHDLWLDRQKEWGRKIAAARSELSAAEKAGVDRTPPEREYCGECGRPYAKQDLDSVIKYREENRKHRIEEAAKELESIIATPDEPEPPTPSNTMVMIAELAAVQCSIDEYTRTADVQVWRKQLAALEHRKTFVAPEAYAQQIAISEEALKKLREERRLAESDRNDRKRLAEARAEHEKAQADEQRYKAAKEFLLEKKEELIEQVFGPLLKIVNTLTNGIARAPFEYLDGEFGYWIETTMNARWISEETFSGTEQALLYAGLQAALGSQSPCRIVMVDELGRLDRANWLQFLMNVHDAREAGMFDQFIGFTPRMEHEEQLLGIGFQLVHATGNDYSTT